jgi:predicted esterase
MVPFTPDLIRNFTALSVFIAAGDRDPFTPRDQTEQLAAVLQSGGADVSLFWHRGGHELGDDDVMAAKRWLEEKGTERPAA